MIRERMASAIGVTIEYISGLANGASHAYKTYRIPKRDGRLRTIHHPSKQLKALQRWLLQNVIENLPVHSAAFAYKKSTSMFDNARAHSKNRFLLRIDLNDFFPSITDTDVRRFIQDRATMFEGWTNGDIDAFCKIICRNGHLTIGAPTSPAISNVLCFDLDSALSSLASKLGVTYTRYADDLFFSTNQAGVLRPLQESVEQTVRVATLPGNLAINHGKTRHSSKKRLRRVTGIVIGSDGKAHVGRGVKRKIRGMIHRFDSLNDQDRASLAGLIAYVIGFDPAFLNSLVTKYGHAAVSRARFPTRPSGVNVN
ncbi:MAG: RNA-directed DNA polymerase [Acidobacteria bacterium]|nr:RNA-directed DNA polymerase [Acidobacteriota bacterium]